MKHVPFAGHRCPVNPAGDRPHCWHTPVEQDTNRVSGTGLYMPHQEPEQVCCYCGMTARQTHGKHYSRLVGM